MPSDGYRLHSAVLAPDLRIEITSVHGTVVCTVAGYLHSDNEDHLRRALDDVLGRRPTMIAIGLAAVRLFTSSSLNALLTARRAAHDRGVPLVLVAPSRGVRHVLEITETHRVFRTVPSFDEAVRPHRGPPPDTV
ncbi:STAS domain-containing protein [Streptomyces sp. NPDC004244]|uniref:STAS domain-containing protein n=1 Tax=Streptomyces sp. NPDC101206 TaxID=3366128 RepID=UPI003827B5DF